jgi:putative transposase
MDECSLTQLSVEDFSEAARAEAYRRREILERCERFIAQQKKGRVKAQREFIKNERERDKALKLSRPVLARWRILLRDKGLVGLCPQYGLRQRENSIPPDVWEQFKKDYLTEDRRSIAVCRRLLTNGWDNARGPLPSVWAFRRAVKRLPRSVVVRFREGEKAFDDKCAPYAERDWTTWRVNQLWISDHPT